MVLHLFREAGGRYVARVESYTLAGFITAWRWRVEDTRYGSDIVAEGVSHQDADALAEACCCMALLLASYNSDLKGAYTLGVSGY